MLMCTRRSMHCQVELALAEHWQTAHEVYRAAGGVGFGGTSGSLLQGDLCMHGGWGF